MEIQIQDHINVMEIQIWEILQTQGKKMIRTNGTERMLKDSIFFDIIRKMKMKTWPLDKELKNYYKKPILGTFYIEVHIERKINI